MKTFCLNNDFCFLETELGISYDTVSEKINEFKPVCIPHDWLISHIENLYLDSIGWYRLIINEDDYDLSEDESLFIQFDGVYMDTTVYLNGREIKRWEYGYTPFGVDLRGLLKKGDNELMLRVNHQEPNSRWYSGAGIYRNVYLRINPKYYLPYDGTYVTMKENGKDFDVEVSTECAVRGELISLPHTDEKSGREVTLRYSLKDKAGKCVISTTDSSFKVKNPKRWSPETPNVYRLLIELMLGDEVMDSDEINVGFRTIEMDPQVGMRLNGKVYKINGMCEHHDFGCLGSAINTYALERKFKKLKEMGVNAIRTSHNPPFREFMDLADEYGMLIDDEAFDMWELSKTKYDYARFFKECHEKDILAYVRRDRNHPSLMMWSIGNEIYDTHANEHGAEITKELIRCVRIADPKENAHVTIASNYMPWENAQKCADITKMAGYNYGEKCYVEHHKKYPDWVIYGSETGSMVASRGVYHFPLNQVILSEEDEQCSALGNSNTSWGATTTEGCLSQNYDNSFNMGMFVWTGFDYIGEPTPYQTKNSYFGQLDTAGFPKDSYYIYQAKWTDCKVNPMVHLFPYWDFNKGQLIDLRVTSNAPYVELFVNGVSYGMRKLNKKKGTGFITDYQAVYEPGEIKAVAYDSNKKVIAEDIHHSFKDTDRLVITCEKDIINPDGKDLVYAAITAVDEDGYPVENAMDYVEINVTGAGFLAGTDNGDSTDYDSYKSNVRKLFNGKLMAVIQSNGQPGEINIEAKLLEDKVPVRKIEILPKTTTVLNKEHDTVDVYFKIFPKNATDKDLEYEVVNDCGIRINYAEIISDKKDPYHIKVKALGDGKFRLRALSKSGTDKVKLISSLEFSAEGLGAAHLNPYEFLSGGLFTGTVGEIGTGNEKGCATQRGCTSAVIYDDLDFGTVGSDTITLPIFALNDEEYEFEIYEGRYGEPSAQLLLKGIYQKPYIWNQYQEETYKLCKPIKGIAAISIVFHEKIHLKGFVFKEYPKAFAKLDAMMCDKIYGDSFKKEESAITNIGNNVTIEFNDMDFGEKGTSGIKITGRSNISVNTMHIIAVDKNKNELRRIIEMPGRKEYTTDTYMFEPIKGHMDIRLVFLPGTEFDLQSIEFI